MGPADKSAQEKAKCKKATRRSPAEVDHAIFVAVLEELAEVGHQRMTFVGIAERAGTGRQALYNRWSSKDDMIIDALEALLPTPPKFVPTGDLRADLISYLPRFGGYQGTVGRAVRSLVAESYRDPNSIVALREHFSDPLVAGIRQLLGEAVARGAANRNALDPNIIEVFPAVMSRYQLQSNRPVPKDAIVAFVDKIFMPLVAEPAADHQS